MSAGEVHERLQKEYVAPWVMKLRNPCDSVGPCAYHSRLAAGLEMTVVDAKGGVELLIDMMSAYGWQKTVDIDRSEP